MKKESKSVAVAQSAEGLQYKQTKKGNYLLSSDEFLKVQKALSDKQNYQKGLLKAKRTLKEIKKNILPKKPCKLAGLDSAITSEPEDKEKYITREDFFKTNEKKAINKACKNEKINKNWVKVIKYYTPRRGKSSSEDIFLDIKDAYYLFRKNEISKPVVEDKKINTFLSSQNRTETGSNVKKGSEKKERRFLRGSMPLEAFYQ